MNHDICLRWGTHELIGVRVRDSTGRVGRLDAVLEYVARGTDRIVRREAHLRPVDGSGWEWTAEADELTRAKEGDG
ncbi:hypothetical protein [Streptomyces hainanensis]|uniref:PRC-barrel domain containing protein n=1 Tax=Streptomyces hainanensis TaxID=402648 RepID=A0A4V2Y3F9_9ACTN|nr:hypothetical protein [Streptomyces hainanensis]TDC76275.1 hypothetical protein E1283_10100 [Streptomyces hainanensis]